MASLTALILLGLLVICPLPACAVSASHQGCCHKSQPQPVRCPMPSIQDCPYFILQKGKVTQATGSISPLGSPVLAQDLGSPSLFSISRTSSRLPDSDGLYLRVHVLLI